MQGPYKPVGKAIGWLLACSLLVGCASSSQPPDAKPSTSAEVPGAQDEPAAPIASPPADESPVGEDGDETASVQAASLTAMALSSAQASAGPEAKLEIRYLLEWSLPGQRRTVPGKLRISDTDTPGNMLELPLALSSGEGAAACGIPETMAYGTSYRLSLQAEGITSPYLDVRFEENGLAERLSRLAAARTILPMLAPGHGYQDSFPVPPGAGTLWVELRPENGGNPIRLPPGAYLVATSAWQSAEYAASLPELPPGQVFQRFYQYRSASGLRSTWQSAGLLRVGPAENMKLLGPVDGASTLCAAPAFRWQEITGLRAATIAFSATSPDSPAFRPGGLAVAPVRNGQPVGDLRAYLPGLKPGALFWWQLRHGGAIPDSPWQSARFDTILDDVVTGLAAGKTASFTMGNDAGAPDQRPARRIEISRPFAIQRLALTNDQFAAIANAMVSEGHAVINAGTMRDAADGTVIAGLSKLDYGEQFGLQESPKGRLSARTGRGAHPVIGVSWAGVQAVCRYLAQATGLRGESAWRLPSEAEWEYVASQGAGLTTPWGGKASTASANFLRSGDRFEDPLPPFTRQGGPTVPADWYSVPRSSIAKNPVAGRNMSPDLARVQLIGNAWEWVADWYLPTGYDPEDLTDPTGPGELSKEQLKSLTVIGQRPSRVVKGGAWNSSQDELYAQNRGKYPPDRTSYSIGFRLARSLLLSTP